jgi:hypothetical protein
VNFKIFLADEYIDYLEDESAENNPFQAGNVAHDETMTALQNIMENMAQYQENITTLNSANALLTSTTNSFQTNIKTLTEQIRLLNSKIPALENGRTPITSPSPASTSLRRRKKYCYTCGNQYHHFSSSCPISPVGHKKEAHWKNKMGGSQVDHTLSE